MPITADSVFTPPTRRAGRRGWEPNADDVKAALRLINDGNWVMTDETASTQREAERYQRAWKAALAATGQVKDPEGVKTTIVPQDPRTGEFRRNPVEGDGTIYRLGIAARSTPSS